MAGWKARIGAALTMCIAIGDGWGASPNASARRRTTAPAASGQPLCAAVHIVGDSLLAGMESSLRAEFAARRLPTPRLDAFGGRGVETRYPQDPRNGLTAIDWLRRFGDADCWVIALGTNDSSRYPPTEYFALVGRLLDRIGAGHRVWLVDVGGPYPRSRFTNWNQAVNAWSDLHPEVAVVGWAAAAAEHPEWFLADGIHLTGRGANGRVALIAQAIVAAEPTTCLPAPLADDHGLVGAIRERLAGCG